jgi:hypothetical protein
MAREPGPEFRWGVLTRRSTYNADGTEGSTRRQELAVCDHKVDRLVRRVSQYRRVLDVLESSGARLFSLVEGIDTADPERKFVNGPILDLLVRLAEMESEGTSERLILMAQDRARQGKHHGGGSRPFGHTLDWFALVPKEAEAIRDAARRILEGEGVYSISRTCPRFLNLETWERVCARLAEPKPHTGSPHTHRLLSEIAQCGRCLVPLRGGKNMESRSLLVETLSFEDVATEWAERPQEWRRAVLRLCTKSIVVEPVGKLAGVTAKGFRFDPERVRVKFAS